MLLTGLASSPSPSKVPAIDGTAESIVGDVPGGPRIHDLRPSIAEAEDGRRSTDDRLTTTDPAASLHVRCSLSTRDKGPSRPVGSRWSRGGRASLVEHHQARLQLVRQTAVPAVDNRPHECAGAGPRGRRVNITAVVPSGAARPLPSSLRGRQEVLQHPDLRTLRVDRRRRERDARSIGVNAELLETAHAKPHVLRSPAC